MEDEEKEMKFIYRTRMKRGKKIWTISRFVRVILAQGPC